MKIEDRLKAIDDFFDAITIEEFEEIAINAGAEDLNKVDLNCMYTSNQMVYSNDFDKKNENISVYKNIYNDTWDIENIRYLGGAA